MSLVRLVGFATLSCGCVVGHYRELATHKDVTYIEEKGADCADAHHRRNHTLTRQRSMSATLNAVTVPVSAHA